DLPNDELLLCFMVHALRVLGFAPQLDQCGRCQRKARASQPVRFEPKLGALICSQCGVAPCALDPKPRWLLRRRWQLGLAHSLPRLDTKELSQARQLVSTFMAEHIPGYPVKTKSGHGTKS